MIASVWISHQRLLKGCFALWPKLEVEFLRNMLLSEISAFCGEKKKKTAPKNPYIFIGSCCSTSSQDSVEWNSRKGRYLLFSHQTYRQMAGCVGMMLVVCACCPKISHTQGNCSQWSTKYNLVNKTKNQHDVSWLCYSLQYGSREIPEIMNSSLII